MKQKAKKDLRKRSIALFAALAVCLTMAQAPAFTVSAHAEGTAQSEPAQNEGQTQQPTEKTEEEKKETPEEEKSDEKKQDETPADPEKTNPDGKTPDPDKPETEEKDLPAGDDENAELPKNFGDECLEAIGDAEDTESVLQAIEDCLSRYDALSDEEKAEFAEVYANLLAYKAEVTGETEGEAVNPLIEVAEGEAAPQADTLQAQIDAAGENGTVTLTDNVTENITIDKSLTLDLGGFVLNGTGEGSVVTVNGGEVVIENGTITGGNSLFGGGVYIASGATVTLAETGEISGNVVEHAEERNQVFGGGVYVAPGGEFILDGGVITGNRAGDPNFYDDKSYSENCHGGGIYISANASFKMYGGSITNNTAVKKGGGVCIGADGKGTVDTTIDAGTIANNAADTGGGIYVAAGTELQLEKVAVSGNVADANNGRGGDGGGIWLCPKGNGYFYATRGAYISGNTAYQRGDDFVTQTWGGFSGNFPTRLYDGTPLHWYEDGKANEWCGPRYTAGAREVDMTDLGSFIRRWFEEGFYGYGFDDMSLHTETTGSSGDYAIEIRENTAVSYGGGIACNGNLTMGEFESDIKLTINKVWDVEEGTELPESITVKVFNNGKEFEEVVLNKENDWKTTLIDLPSDGKYTVEEVSVEGYESTVTEMAKAETFDQENNREYAITITNKPAAPKGSLIINKNLAENAPEEARNKEYTFKVTGPNEYNETVTITGAGASDPLENLEPGDYTVTEEDAAIAGYNWTVSVNGNSGSTITVSVEGGADAAVVTFTNSYERPTTPPDEPDEPETPPYNPPPRRPTPPEEEVPEEEPPLAETPEVEVPEEDVPLAEMPPEEEIPEEEVPLADIPKTGDTDGSLWAALLAFSMAGVALIARKLRGSELRGEKNS